MRHKHLQVKTHNVKLSDIIATRHFQMGYDEGSRGKDFNKFYDDWKINEQWNYERGRLVGAIARQYSKIPRLFSTGKKVNKDVYRIAINANAQGLLV